MNSKGFSLIELCSFMPIAILSGIALTGAFLSLTQGSLVSTKISTKLDSHSLLNSHIIKVGRLAESCVKIVTLSPSPIPSPLPGQDSLECIVRFDPNLPSPNFRNTRFRMIPNAEPDKSVIAYETRASSNEAWLEKHSYKGIQRFDLCPGSATDCDLAIFPNTLTPDPAVASRFFRFHFKTKGEKRFVTAGAALPSAVYTFKSAFFIRNVATAGSVQYNWDTWEVK